MEIEISKKKEGKGGSLKNSVLEQPIKMFGTVATPLPKSFNETKFMIPWSENKKKWSKGVQYFSLPFSHHLNYYYCF